MAYFRSTLLVLSLLTGCAANDFGLDDTPGRSPLKPDGAFGAYLSGRFAAQRMDPDFAADRLAVAAETDEAVPAVATQAFVAATLAGRPAAIRLAAALPDNPAAQLVLANQDVLAGRWAEAERKFTALAPSSLSQVLRPLVVAWAQQGAGRTQAALLTLEPGIESPGLRGLMALHGALIADMGGQQENAARLFEVARGAFGTSNLRFGQLIANWQYRSGRVTEAQESIRDAVGTTGDLALSRPALEAAIGEPALSGPADGIAEAYLAMAAALLQQGATEPALLLLRLSLDLRPGFDAARLILAETQDRAGQGVQAQATLAAVQANSPLIATVRLRQAALYARAGETGTAAQILEQLATAYPNRPEPLSTLGELYRLKERYPEAISALDRAIARVGSPARAAWPLYYQRAVALDRSGDWPRAEADLRFALELMPDQPSLLNYLGYAWVDQGRNLAEARVMIERAAAQRPQDGSIVDSLGWVMLMQGQVAPALEQLERAVALEPSDPVVNGHLGDALAGMGRMREAEFQWRRALTLNPDAPERERIETRLHDVAP